MTLLWHDWLLVVAGVLVVVLVVFSTVLAMKAKRFTVKEKNGERKARTKR